MTKSARYIARLVRFAVVLLVISVAVMPVAPSVLAVLVQGPSCFDATGSAPASACLATEFSQMPFALAIGSLASAPDGPVYPLGLRQFPTFVALVSIVLGAALLAFCYAGHAVWRQAWHWAGPRGGDRLVGRLGLNSPIARLPRRFLRHMPLGLLSSPLIFGLMAKSYCSEPFEQIRGYGVCSSTSVIDRAFYSVFWSNIRPYGLGLAVYWPELLSIGSGFAILTTILELLISRLFEGHPTVGSSSQNDGATGGVAQ